MSKKNLADTLANRSPLTRRETVTPANLYQTPPEDADTPDATHPESRSSGNQESQEPREPESRKSRKAETPKVEKYSTQLRPDTIKAIRREAIERECKDYELVQAALDAFLKK